jgi:uncharacterized protein
VTTLGTWRRVMFAALGLLSVGLGFVGVFVPGMPTTVFVIAASYFFARSSPRLDAWLHRNRWLGPALRRYRETGGMDVRSKSIALATMWAGLAVSWVALANVSTMLQLATLGLGLIGTATILFYVRTARPVQSTSSAQ